MKRLIALVTAAAIALPSLAQAGLIRDAEIESTLRDYATPILRSADIPPEDVRILIVDNPTINAYVAGGLNIFIFTGLIRVTKAPGELIGVIAHETGHIAGAHLSQLREKSTRATLGGVIGALLGAAAIAGGAGSAGAGVIMGSQNMAARRFASDIRINEQSADHAALQYLDDNDISATGMLATFETLRRQESGLAVKADPYLRDHPLTSDRIATIRNHIRESRIPEGQVPDGFDEKQARMVAKLVAFTEPYERTLALYPTTDTTVAARYARAIAEYKRSQLPAALAGIDGLIKASPSDPFFYDTKGQMLFENGRLDEAEKAYARASTLLPGSALILTDYARTLIATDKQKDLPRAIALLERSKEIDDSYSNTWRQLAIAYGKEGRLGLSYSALAEEASLGGDYKTVLQHVARARQFARDENDPALDLMLDDLQRDAQAQLEKKKENNLF
jgi:predicted Zn-dependent protease